MTFFKHLIQFMALGFRVNSRPNPAGRILSIFKECLLENLVRKPLQTCFCLEIIRHKAIIRHRYTEDITHFDRIYTLLKTSMVLIIACN